MAIQLPRDWECIVSEESINKAVSHLAASLDSKFSPEDKVVLVCILKGAAYCTVDISRAMTHPHSIYFIEASSYKNSQVQADAVEVYSLLIPEKFAGKHVILIDELYDTGKTMNTIKNLIAAIKGVKTITTCVVFTKDTGKELKYPLPNLSGITIPNEWVVGYGLDHQQEFRNLKALYRIPRG